MGQDVLSPRGKEPAMVTPSYTQGFVYLIMFLSLFQNRNIKPGWMSLHLSRQNCTWPQAEQPFTKR